MSYDEAIFQMYLGEVPMFQACSEEELSAVAYLASPLALEAGTASCVKVMPGTTSTC